MGGMSRAWRSSTTSSWMCSPRRALAGNPLAVVMNTIGLETERMQAIAREFNLSETTFVAAPPRPRKQAEGVRVRIFTTQEELTFAGHPTLGTASVLKLVAAGNGAGRRGHAGVECGRDSGAVSRPGRRSEPVRRDDAARPGVRRGARPGRGGALMRPCGGRSRPSAAAAGGLHRNRICDRAAAIDRCAGPAQGESRRRPRRGCAIAEARWFYVLAPDRSQARRSAVSRADAVLWRRRPGHRLGRRMRYQLSGGSRSRASEGSVFIVRQGVEIGRPSDLFLSARRENARVTRCAGRGQHCSCGKRTAFPAVMHMLSTGIHLVNFRICVTPSRFPSVSSSFPLPIFAFFPSFHGSVPRTLAKH